MRIRMLAAAVVTAGALMATLTGAASADTPTPAPLPGDSVVLVDCEGGGQVTLMTRRLTEAEREELEKSGAALAVPALPALPSGQTGGFGKTEAGRVTIAEDVLAVRPGEEPPAPPKDLKVMTAPLPTGAVKPGEPGEPGATVTLSRAVPAPDGAAATEVRVEGKLSEGGTPSVTCVSKAEEE
ncbi:hypothetical protein ACSDR0_25455 [Streptosporangium sp. G11]|uniref:hypothetical protein n=1 Tax=Streptosporangium sp. G11 TaxID=3436926 RepID=UPI003EBC6014